MSIEPSADTTRTEKMVLEARGLKKVYALPARENWKFLSMQTWFCVKERWWQSSRHRELEKALCCICWLR